MSLDDRLDLEGEIKELFISKFKEFISFCAEMQINEQDRARDPWALDLSEEYINGYNAGVSEGVETALSLWIEEHSY